MIVASCAQSSLKSGCEWAKPTYFYGQEAGVDKQKLIDELVYDPKQKIWYSKGYDILTYETETEILAKNKTYKDICK